MAQPGRAAPALKRSLLSPAAVSSCVFPVDCRFGWREAVGNCDPRCLCGDLAKSQAAESNSESAAHPEPFGTSANVKLQMLSEQINYSSQNSGSPCKSAGSYRGNSPACPLRSPDFKNKVSIDDGEGSSFLPSETAPRSDTRPGPENAALVNFIAAHGWNGWKRCVSLPVEQVLDTSPSTSGCETRIQHHNSQECENPTKVSRSLSVPTQNVVIVKSGSFGIPEKLVPANSEDGQVSPPSIANEDVEIPEEEAVCRICLSELTEGRSWLKMECSCKGALQLTHAECAVKWFSIKGNRNCDVCGQEVLNLPVTLLRVQSSAQRNNVHQHTRQSPTLQEWQDGVVLVLISTMCYFFFLEQLLVKDMKAHAMVVAAPVSFTLSILSSVFAVTLVHKEYVWAYSAFQFSLVCAFLHLLYSALRLRVLYAVVFSAVAGLGLALGVNLMSSTFCLASSAYPSTDG